MTATAVGYVRSYQLNCGVSVRPSSWNDGDGHPAPVQQVTGASWPSAGATASSPTRSDQSIDNPRVPVDTGDEDLGPKGDQVMGSRRVGHTCLQLDSACLGAT